MGQQGEGFHAIRVFYQRLPGELLNLGVVRLAGSGPGEGGAEEGAVGIGGGDPTELRDDGHAGGGAELRAERGLVAQREHGGGERGERALDDESARSVREILGHGAGVGGDERAAGGGGFEEGVVVALEVGGADHGVHGRVELAHLLAVQVAVGVATEVQLNTRELAEKRTSGLPKTIGHIFGFPDYNLSKADGAIGKKRALSQFYGFASDEIPALPATEKETEMIGDILTAANWKVSSFIKSEATEANVKLLDSPGLLHVATHGFFLSDLDVEDGLDKDDASEIVENPLFRSGLLLAGVSAARDAAQVEDGILTAYEAMNLSLDQTELVALSACETGLGEVRNGEGVYGLQRAFNVAGAKAVLMSLWQVDDAATQELMTTFYSLWLKEGDKHSAFRQAQLALKKKYPEPYYWGAFVLSGH